ncbi:MAG: nucleotidyltransferase family protein [Rhodospirillaceae bacterium]|nr:nucleotidyltransferase family protein [Rhodospirillaceae bacterium]
MPTFYTVILLAGDRPGDVLAQRSPGKRKALLLLQGRPMILYVLETLLAGAHVGDIVVVANRVAEIEANADLQAFVALHKARISFREGAGSPATSVMKCMKELGGPRSVLVTTADNPLLTPQTLDSFCEGIGDDADAVVGLARERDIRPAFPDVKRTYIRLGGEGYSGCNLFALTAEGGPKAARAWSEVEGRRKKPWQLVMHFGVWTLLRAVTGFLDLDGAMGAVSRAMGLKAKAVILNDPAASMDVDRPDHIPMAESVLAARKTS